MTQTLKQRAFQHALNRWTNRVGQWTGSPRHTGVRHELYEKTLHEIMNSNASMSSILSLLYSSTH